MRALTACLLVVGVLAAGCGGKDKSASSEDGAIALADALEFAPERTGDDYRVTFTDWRAIAAALDIDVERQAQATDLLVRTAELGTPFADPAPTELWSQADVDWEARLGPDAAHEVVVIALRKGFDFAAAIKYLDQCDLDSERQQGATVYEASIADVAECAGEFGTDIPIYPSIAIDPGRRAILLAHNAETLESALDGDETVESDDDLVALKHGLGRSQSLTIELRTAFCTDMTKALAGRNPTPEVIARAESETPAGEPYKAFAAALHYTKDGAEGTFALRYADADAAGDDLAAREQALREGRSFVTARPYADLVRLGDARADGENLIFEVHPPVEGAPLPLNEMYQRADLGFARC